MIIVKSGCDFLGSNESLLPRTPGYGEKDFHLKRLNGPKSIAIIKPQARHY